MRLLQISFNLFSQLPASLAGNNFHFADPFFNSFPERVIKGFVNSLAIIINIMQIDPDLCHNFPGAIEVNDLFFW